MTKQSNIQRLLETFYPTPLTGIPPFTAHPFYPIATLLPGYVPNTLTPIEMLAIFFSILGTWMYGALLYARATSSIGKLSSKDQAWVLWFAASGIIHMTFEGESEPTASLLFSLIVTARAVPWRENACNHACAASARESPGAGSSRSATARRRGRPLARSVPTSSSSLWCPNARPDLYLSRRRDILLCGVAEEA